MTNYLQLKRGNNQPTQLFFEFSMTFQQALSFGTFTQSVGRGFPSAAHCWWLFPRCAPIISLDLLSPVVNHFFTGAKLHTWGPLPGPPKPPIQTSNLGKIQT